MSCQSCVNWLPLDRKSDEEAPCEQLERFVRAVPWRQLYVHRTFACSCYKDVKRSFERAAGFEMECWTEGQSL